MAIATSPFTRMTLVQQSPPFTYPYQNLTLYTNATFGNWATPQTVIYLIIPATHPTSAPSLPSPTPTVPEFSAWIILPLFAVTILLSPVIIRKRIEIE